MNVDGTGLKMVSTAKRNYLLVLPSQQRKMIFASNHLDQRPPKCRRKSKSRQTSLRAGTWPFYPGMDVYEYTFATTVGAAYYRT